ncbi:MAG: zinc-dependent metalloprotease [Deltaproteobacteria bacterium]|nr:zinc-dependent metalloprotease [Deltaproteobacteria bacterium]
MKTKYSAIALLGFALFAPLFANASTPELSVAPGQVIDLPDLNLSWETFSLSEDAHRALTSGGEEPIAFRDFPTSPGAREAIRFAPFEIFAPGAKMWLVSWGEKREIPRDPSRHFRGRSASGDTRVGLSVRPDGSIFGFVAGSAGDFHISGPNAQGSFSIEDASPSSDLEYAGCGTEHLPIPDSFFTDPPSETTRKSSSPLLGASRQAVIAVDTDVEFNQEKFGNNEANALTWIGDLFTSLNTMYERDLDLSLLQGDTSIRIGSDPFNNTDSPASQAQLTEFGNWWSANQSGVDRVFAMLLSGKSPSSNSGSGIAWVDGYCENQSSGGGYSINQIFTGNFPASSDARLVGHELGHNAGSPHTHCYNPVVDTCYNAETGCYSGAVSCPGGAGTVMSYCNFGAPNGAGCGQNQLVFHPTVQGRIGTLISNHFPGCVTSALGDIFADGFESGNTTAWTTTVP